MCGACGVLGGGPEWLDRAGNPEGVGGAAGLTRGAERQRRVRLVNLLLAPHHLRLSDLGNKLVVRGPTGRTELVDSLMHVWAAAERLSGRPIDPLDPASLPSAAQLSPPSAG
jgi:hypothetical protein